MAEAAGTLSEVRREARERIKQSGCLRILRGAERAVLMQYIRRMDEQREAFPDGPMLAGDTGYSVGQVKRRGRCWSSWAC